MPNLRVVPVNAADTAALVASPAAVSTMGIGNVQLIDRDSVFRSTSLAQQLIVGDWGGDLRAISAWSLLRANLLGAQVKLRLFSDVARTAESYNSGFIVVYPAMPGWGDFNWGEVPWGVAANDPLATEAPFIKFLSPTIYAAAFEITIENLGGMSASYFEVGRLWLGEYLEAQYQAEYGKQLAWNSSSVAQRTRGGSQRPLSGARWRELRMQLFVELESYRARWTDLTALLEFNKAALWSLFPEQGGRDERDHTLEALIEGASPSTHPEYGFFEQPFVIKET